MSTRRSTTSHDRGLAAERLAALWLRAKAYRILARRFRCPAGEIDLIAKRGRTLAFVEVKARPDETAGLEAITAHSRARIAAAASVFLARHPRYAGCDMRFDALTVSPRRWPHHLPDAWRP